MGDDERGRKGRKSDSEQLYGGKEREKDDESKGGSVERAGGRAGGRRMKMGKRKGGKSGRESGRRREGEREGEGAGKEEEEKEREKKGERSRRRVRKGNLELKIISVLVVGPDLDNHRVFRLLLDANLLTFGLHVFDDFSLEPTYMCICTHA